MKTTSSKAEALIMNKNDLKLILILLLLISLSLIIINKTKKEGTTAIVYYENKENSNKHR